MNTLPTALITEILIWLQISDCIKFSQCSHELEEISWCSWVPMVRWNTQVMISNQIKENFIRTMFHFGQCSIGFDYTNLGIIKFGDQQNPPCTATKHYFTKVWKTTSIKYSLI